MEEKLNRLYKECVKELEGIKFEITNNTEVGNIDICIAKRNNKRYGCCKHEEPDETDYHVTKYKNNFKIIYHKFKKHHIEISRWVMDLDEVIIKNTIIHEILHCLPYCNNHGLLFQNYACYINQELGYNIKTLGNKQADYKRSNLDFEADHRNYKYKIVCKECGNKFYRHRLKKDLIKKYRCSICGGKLELNQ